MVDTNKLKIVAGSHFVCGIRPKLTREPLNHARHMPASTVRHLEQALSILADSAKVAFFLNKEKNKKIKKIMTKP